MERKLDKLLNTPAEHWLLLSESESESESESDSGESGGSGYESSECGSNTFDDYAALLSSSSLSDEDDIYRPPEPSSPSPSPSPSPSIQNDAMCIDDVDVRPTPTPVPVPVAIATDIAPRHLAQGESPHLALLWHLLHAAAKGSDWFAYFRHCIEHGPAYRLKGPDHMDPILDRLAATAAARAPAAPCAWYSGGLGRKFRIVDMAHTRRLLFWHTAQAPNDDTWRYAQHIFGIRAASERDGERFYTTEWPGFTRGNFTTSVCVTEFQRAQRETRFVPNIAAAIRDC
jgi:hypothetical protein